MQVLQKRRRGQWSMLLDYQGTRREGMELGIPKFRNYFEITNNNRSICEYYPFFERLDSFSRVSRVLGLSGVSGVSGWDEGVDRLCVSPSARLDERSCILRSPKAGFFSSMSKIELTAESLVVSTCQSTVL